MNKYIIPICNIDNSDVHNLIINASSYKDCQEKIMDKFIDYSDNPNYHEFLDELDEQNILIGEIIDVEAL